MQCAIRKEYDNVHKECLTNHKIHNKEKEYYEIMNDQLFTRKENILSVFPRSYTTVH